MANDKARGKSGLTTDMIKNLPPKVFDLYVEFIQEFWRDDSTDFDSWHVTILNMLYKGKDDHHGIVLNETSAKVLSKSISKRLLHRLKQVGTNAQFGHIGCQEAQHILKRVLLLRHQHGLESYAIFVNLVKAFDTVHHDLLCKILNKYGLLEDIVKTVAKLYKNCIVKIKVEKKVSRTSLRTKMVTQEWQRAG
jgi:hypothetical protein